MAVLAPPRPDSDIDDERNPGQRDWDRRTGAVGSSGEDDGYDNPSETSLGLLDRENEASEKNNNSDDNTQDVRDQEQAGFTNNYTGEGGKESLGQSLFKSLKGGNLFLAKRVGPTGFAGIIIGLLMVVIFGALGPASLIVNLKENFVSNHDTQAVVSESRSTRILNSRLAKATTSSLCAAEKSLACRYNTPSNKLLERLDKAGIKALDKNGQVIDKQDLLHRTRPAKFSFDDKEVDATKFMDEMRSNPEFRRAFQRAYNARWVNWVDDVASGVFNKLRVSRDTPEKIKNADTAEEIQEAVDDLGKTPDGDKDSAERLAKEAVEKDAKKVARTSRGDSTLLVAQMGCLAINAPKTISRVSTAYKIAQLAPPAMMVLVVADKIKAGKATPEEVNVVGRLLTDVARRNNQVIGSPMESEAMKYGLGIGTGGADSKYIPGRTSKGLAPFIQFSEQSNVVDACSAVSSLEAQTAVHALDALKALKAGTGPIGLAMLGIDGAMWVLDATGVLDDIVAGTVGVAVSFISKFIDWDGVMESLVGDATKGAVGPDFGDIVAIGAIYSFGTVARKRGNFPLSISQRVAFEREIAEPIRLAWAEDDRATHSPLDASNPNTLMGAITTKLLPYQFSASNPIGMIRSIANISTGSFGNLFNPTTSAESYTNLCTADPSVAGTDYAAGPLCDPYYGVPREYMDIEPDAVVLELHRMGQLNESDEPKSGSDLSDWISECGDSDTPSVTGCGIVGLSAEEARKVALFALYQIDKSILEGMDKDQEVTGDPNSGSSSGRPVNREGWTMPVKEGITVTSPFGPRNPPLSGDSPICGHCGMDFGARQGEPIFAIHSGTVSDAIHGDACAGNFINITHDVNGEKFKSSYLHMTTLDVSAGDSVIAGQTIGTAGNTGSCTTGPHLHLGLRDSSGAAIDPAPYIMGD